jgi:hypothetical protein
MTQSSLSAISTAELLKRKAQLESRKAQQNFSTLSTEELLRRKAELEQTTGGNRVASIGKAAVAGALGGLADLTTAPYNMGAAAHNFQRENMDPEVLNAAARFNPDMPSVPYDAELPMIPSATEAIDSGIDSLTGGYTRTPEGQRWLNEGVKFGASLATPGGLAKAGVKGMSALGTLRPAGLAGGFAAGATGEALRDKGAVASFGGGLGAGLAVDALARNPVRRLVNIIGYGKNALDTKAYDAAKSLGLDLPNITFTTGAIPTAVHTFEKRLPYFGDKLKEKMQKAGADFQDKFDKMLDKEVGLQKTENRIAEQNKLYDTVTELLQEEGDVDVTNVLEAIQAYAAEKPPGAEKQRLEVLNTLKDFKKGVTAPTDNLTINGTPLSEFEKDVQKQILEKLKEESKLTPTLKPNLAWEQKKDWNKIVKGLGGYDPTKDMKSPAGALHNINDILKDALKGQISETASSALETADKFFASGAKRDAVDKLLQDKLYHYSKGVSYSELAKAFESRNGQKILKNALGENGFRAAEKFIDVAKGIAKVGDFNPSGSGVIVILANLLKKIVTEPATPALSLLGKALFKNETLVEYAMAYAKKPTLSRAQKLEKLFQEETGLSMQSLVQSVNKDRKPNK